MNHLKFALITASVLSLSACVVTPYRYYDSYADDTVVDVAPPAPYTEVVPVAPYVGAVWIDGYWGWSGGRHVWYGGHYEHGRPGYFYRQNGWSHDGGRYHFHRGGWMRHH